DTGPLASGAPAAPQARCVVAPAPTGFEACVDLHIEPAQPVRLRASSASPFQAVWQATESAAWLARLHELFSARPGEQDELRWERLTSLSHVALRGWGTSGPLLSAVWRAQIEVAPLDQRSDLVMEAAW